MNITYKMGKGTETFGNIEIEKKNFHNHKNPISILCKH